MTLTSSQAFDEPDKLKIVVGDVIEVIEGRWDNYKIALIYIVILK